MFQIGDWRWRNGDFGAGCLKYINASIKQASPISMTGMGLTLRSLAWMWLQGQGPASVAERGTPAVIITQ